VTTIFRNSKEEKMFKMKSKRYLAYCKIGYRSNAFYY